MLFEAFNAEQLCPNRFVCGNAPALRILRRLPLLKLMAYRLAWLIGELT